MDKKIILDFLNDFANIVSINIEHIRPYFKNEECKGKFGKLIEKLVLLIKKTNPSDLNKIREYIIHYDANIRMCLIDSEYRTNIIKKINDISDRYKKIQNNLPQKLPVEGVEQSLKETTKEVSVGVGGDVEGVAYTAEVGGAKSKSVYLADESAAKSFGEDGTPIVKYKYKLKKPLVIEKDSDFDVVNKLINDYQKENPNAKFHPDITNHVNKELEKLGYDGLIIKKEALDTEKGYNEIGGTYGEPQIVVFNRKNISVEQPLKETPQAGSVVGGEVLLKDIDKKDKNYDSIEEAVKGKNFIKQTVSIDELIAKDKDLQEYLNDNKQTKGRKIEKAIIVGDIARGGETQKGGVIDGFHRIAQAIANGEIKIEAYVEQSLKETTKEVSVGVGGDVKDTFENREAIEDNLKDLGDNVYYHGSDDISYLNGKEDLNTAENTKNAESKYLNLSPKASVAVSYSISRQKIGEKSGVAAFKLKGKGYTMKNADIKTLKSNADYEAFYDKKKSEGYDYVKVPQDANDIVVLNNNAIEYVGKKLNREAVEQSLKETPKAETPISKNKVKGSGGVNRLIDDGVNDGVIVELINKALKKLKEEEKIININERIYDFDDDINLIYNNFFKEFIDTLKKKDIIDFNLLKRDTISTSVFKSQRLVQANKNKECLIKINVGGQTNYYSPKTSEIRLGIPLSLYNYITDIIREIRSMDATEIFNEIYDYESSSDIKARLTEYVIKGTIGHELSHWADDSINNNYMEKYFNKIENPNNPNKIIGRYKKQNKFDKRYTSPIEIEALIYNIQQAYRLNKKNWDDFTYEDLMDLLPSLKLIYKKLNHDKKNDLKKYILKRMSREGLLGKKMKYFYV